MLDQGGRVALLLHQPGDAPASLLPIPVEVHLAPSTDDLHQQLGELLRWADQCIVGLPSAELPSIAALIRQQRFRLEPGFALAYAHADYACGFGACLACVVAKPDGGYTRACLNGPFFPLERTLHARVSPRTGIHVESPSTFNSARQRVRPLSKVADLEVQMWPRAIARAAHGPDHLSLRHDLAFLDTDIAANAHRA